ncbi:PIN2/TERF1-interacting telomerase inhibitor 1 isoform X1 [Drosophila novamexicana]|uniref:PIN2/TERF1-interacting telomerase inhibitor 1 isoform X1 n=1 Tax=Drosophila novamexicana TaxID=47314 RepID=UPI0011E5DE8F|nr:PIN2/TERF1-interacting telomerase inhibitor 1 isoform X1 [Drosophila novamexicana]
MAMLAEPRRRKRYNLCPRGKALYEDDTRFGTKMLEKMGWSKGRGLGANLDGSQEFVRVRFKNDAEGLGYETRDDQWTTHEEGFNGLLKALNGDVDNEANGNASASEEETRPMGFGFKAAAAAEEAKPKTLKENISGISLEEKSKSSKARVHYKKFTRGKDLSQYSEKDLANIFGKKATDDIETPVQIVQQPEEEEQPVNPNFAGVHTVSTGLSVNDYFKQKMEAMKKRLSSNNNPNDASAAETNTLSNEAAFTPTKNEEQLPKKKKKKKDKSQKQEDQPEAILPAEIDQKQKKKKKSKRAADEDAVELEKELEAEEANPPKRKKKKKDKQEVAEETPAPIEPTAEADEHKKKKKSKKTEEIMVETPEENVLDKPAKKIKKSKTENKEELIVEETEFNEKPAKKKSKKSKTQIHEEPIEEETTSKTKKKSKKQVVDVDTPPTEATASTEPPPAKAKKTTKTHESEVSAAESDIVCSSDSTAAKDSGELLSMEQLIEKQNSYNVFKISSFCAEKFHILNMNAFRNATLAEITGYALDNNIELKIVELKNDAERILNLWEGKQDKYMAVKNKVRYIASKIKHQKLKQADIRKIVKVKAFSGI